MTDEQHKIAILESDIFTMHAIAKDLLKDIELIEDEYYEANGTESEYLRGIRRKLVQSLSITVNRFGAALAPNSRRLAMVRTKINGKESAKIVENPHFYQGVKH